MSDYKTESSAFNPVGVDGSRTRHSNSPGQKMGATVSSSSSKEIRSTPGVSILYTGSFIGLSDPEEEEDGVKDSTESFNLLLNRPEATALRSGHCMKEDCSICKALDNVQESRSSVVVPVPVKDVKELDKDSNVSLGICRICHCNPESLPELGPLESVCLCRGTVALVHLTCLERWLAESDTTSCELCRFQFTVRRIPRHGALQSIPVWVNQVADFHQVQKDVISLTLTLPLMTVLASVTLTTLAQLLKQCMRNSASTSFACAEIKHFLLISAKNAQSNLKFKLLMDTIWFWLMTPLAAMAGYIFIRAATELIDESSATEAPWLMAALLFNSVLTLMAYYGWAVTSVNRHISCWYKWWRTVDCSVKVLLPPSTDRKVQRVSSDESVGSRST